MLDIFQNRSKKYGSIMTYEQAMEEEVVISESALTINRINVAPLLTHVIQNLMPLAKSKGIHFDVSLLPADIFCETDRDLFYRLAYNLIGDSLRHTSQDGYVRLDAYNVGLDFILKVVNDGPAISKEEIGVLFNLANGSSESIPEEIIIPALGLERVKQIVNAHKGQLAVESRDGRGTVFMVKLPMIGDVYH